MDPVQRPDEDVRRASAARVYNYYLGGSQNFGVDKEFGDRMIAAVPEVPIVAKLNRAFLRRAVRTCVRAGIRQFLDLGSGIPGPDSVLDFADSVTQGCRVLYVDAEPVAVRCGQAALHGHPRTAMMLGDVRDPDAILRSAQASELLELSQPIGVLMLGVLHYLPDTEDPYDLVASYRDRIAPGSIVVISHGTADARPVPVRAMLDLSQADQDAAYMRTATEITNFLVGLRLLPPGVVYLPDWRPEEGDYQGTEQARVMAYAGAGLKP